MKITAIKTWTEELGLVRPYTIASTGTVDSVANIIIEISLENGLSGLGAAAPSGTTTGETPAYCQQVLEPENLKWLLGREIDSMDATIVELERKLADTPAARAAIDIALHDALAKCRQMPLVELLGQHHERLPTSITIGIMSLEESLEEAREYIGRGFKSLKVKIGLTLEQDIEIVTRLREVAGSEIAIRVDANQGYEVEEFIRFIDRTCDLKLEFVEQPFKADRIDDMKSLDERIRQHIAADESLFTEEDARNLAAAPRACGIFNIKLMKSGGVHHALRIAEVARSADIALMWGCMDESIISISAALHAAFACPNTKYIDLDGSLDLKRDVVEGGFILEDGYMSVVDKPGLGVERVTNL
jgi:L-alanine-DL-glutamate epimerase-like enolase superfamily enzyme